MPYPENGTAPANPNDDQNGMPPTTPTAEQNGKSLTPPNPFTQSLPIKNKEMSSNPFDLPYINELKEVFGKNGYGDKTKEKLCRDVVYKRNSRVSIEIWGKTIMYGIGGGAKGRSQSNFQTNLFGRIYLRGITEPCKNKTMRDFIKNWSYTKIHAHYCYTPPWAEYGYYIKCGIEILGQRPKAKGNTFSNACYKKVSQFKEACKKNGINTKGLDKIGLMKALMSV